MSKKAKVSGSVVAGFPSPAEQYQETPLDLNELLVKRPAATFFVKVQGESMIGEGIHEISPERSEHCEAMSLEGCDLLVVDRSLRPASGDVSIACVDGDFTVKTYRRVKRDEGRGMREEIRLEPANPDFPVIVLKRGQELDYFGKVTACIHLFSHPSSPIPHPSPLYKAIDAINAHYGKGKVFSASEGIGEKSWKMKRSKLSKRASTRWDELMVVR